MKRELDDIHLALCGLQQPCLSSLTLPDPQGGMLLSSFLLFSNSQIWKTSNASGTEFLLGFPRFVHTSDLSDSIPACIAMRAMMNGIYLAFERRHAGDASAGSVIGTEQHNSGQKLQLLLDQQSVRLSLLIEVSGHSVFQVASLGYPYLMRKAGSIESNIMWMKSLMCRARAWSTNCNGSLLSCPHMSHIMGLCLLPCASMTLLLVASTTLPYKPTQKVGTTKKYVLRCL